MELLLKWANGEREEQIRMMDTVAPQWRDLGIALSFVSPELDTIEEACLRNPKRCIERLFSQWFTWQSGYSWKMLIEALEVANFPTLARDLKRALPHKRLCSHKRQATEH